MDLKSLLQALVETDDKETRLLMVEENAALMEPAEPGETGEPGEDWEAKYNALLDRYTKAFFNGPEPDADPAPDADPEPEPVSLDELFPQ